MASLSVVEDDRFDSICYWKENCACDARKSGDFRDCQCGLAREKGLVCSVCEAELVIRHNNTKNNTCFWACSNFSRTGCQFTKAVGASLTQAVGAPTQATTEEVAAPAAKRPRHVTPNHPIVAGRESNRTTRLGPTCLFPPKTLHDTFIDADLADDVDASLRRIFTEGSSSRHPHRLHFAEKQLPNEICCYWYTQQDNIGTRLSPVPLTRKPVVLELFAGAGGMSLGLARAGFEVKFAVESNDAAADTLRSNHKDMFVFHQNVVKFLDEASLTPKQNPFYPIQVDHIHASPPCQGFSQAKKQICSSTPVLDRQNNELMHQFSRAVCKFRPTTASLENVQGILESDEKKRYLQIVVADLLKMEYQVRVAILNAQDYGVPQNRKRLFLFASRKGFPLPQLPIRPLQSISTVGMVLGNLETNDPVQEGVPVLCSGSNEPVYNHNIADLPCYEKMEYLQRDMPANTLRRRNDIQHYKYDRSITVRERARLQSFPDSYHFCGIPEQQCDQIGNAVPVKLAEAVGKSIMEAYLA